MQRHLHDISPLSTSYEMGLKRVLLSSNESGCSITQIAVIDLKAGEKSAMHIHPDLQDAFYILDGILEVTLPMILPTKAKAKAEYLFEPLFFAMENFSKSKEVFINEKAMMCIEFVYDKNNKNIRRGDHDNKEVKQVIDAISSFVVPDDSDNYLSLCQISSEGEYNHTKVYVMSERCFGAFFLDHSKNK